MLRSGGRELTTKVRQLDLLTDDLVRGIERKRSMEDAQALEFAGRKKLLEESGFEQAENIRSSVLDMLILKCLLHITVRDVEKAVCQKDELESNGTSI